MLAWRTATNAPVPTELNSGYNPDSIPQGFTTYDDIKSQVKTGCTLAEYTEYDATANALDMAACLTPIIPGKSAGARDVIIERWPAVVNIIPDKKHSISVTSLSGRVIFNDQSVKSRVYYRAGTI